MNPKKEKTTYCVMIRNKNGGHHTSLCSSSIYRLFASSSSYRSDFQRLYDQTTSIQVSMTSLLGAKVLIIFQTILFSIRKELISSQNRWQVHHPTLGVCIYYPSRIGEFENLIPISCLYYIFKNQRIGEFVFLIDLFIIKNSSNLRTSLLLTQLGLRSHSLIL